MFLEKIHVFRSLFTSVLCSQGRHSASEVVLGCELFTLDLAQCSQVFYVHRADTQTTLVRWCWSELFTLGLAQCSQIMCLPTILAAILNHLQTSLQNGEGRISRIPQTLRKSESSPI